MQKTVSVRPLSESKEWKQLLADIKKANQDPEFRAAVRHFIEKATSHK